MIGVLGCIAEAHQDRILQRFPYVDLIVGPRRISQIADLLAKVTENETHLLALGRAGELLEAEASALRRDDKSAFVRVIVGCDNFCSFCIVPYVRGPEISRPPEAIVEQIKKLADKGVKQVTLLGQTVNSYRYEPCGLAELLDFVS